MRKFGKSPILEIHRHSWLCYVLIFACFPFYEVRAQRMEKAEEPDEVGLVTVGKGYFPKPEGIAEFKILNGNFEDEYQKSDALELSRFESASVGAPEGERYIRVPPKSLGSLVVNVPVEGATAYLFSMWLKTSGELEGLATCDTREVTYGKHTPLNLPQTHNEWKRVGLYFRAAPGSESVRILVRRPPDGPELALDDLRFREASPEEFARAYTGWRSQYPARDLSPRPEDGKNLALFVSKLENADQSTEPLLVMGIGSSYTNMLGNGERLIQWIHEKFPEAPPIVYKKHVGSAVNFDFTRGWMRQYVLGQQPDLVILYSGGDAQDLELLLKDFRSHSTADVIVASLHLRERDVEITDKTVNAPEWDAIREVALKYGCEWVDNRREWAAYLKEHDKPIDWLLKDAVHQSDHGALVINENICRHIVANAAPSYNPEERERVMWFANDAEAPKIRFGEKIETEGEAGIGEGLRPGADSLILKNNGTSSVQVDFRGNRIDLIGRFAMDGGRMPAETIEIDGMPLNRFPAFFTTLIVPGPKNHKPERGSAADRSPHMIRLGDLKKIVPQTWTLRMTSDHGDYELIGSITGPDGQGNNGEDFASESGQIVVPTALWRRRFESDGKTHANLKGDTFSWKVRRATTSEVSFRGNPGEIFEISLADQLENGRHELFVGSGQDGPCEILGFRIFEPPFTLESD